MKLYLYQVALSPVTNNWHDGGGVVVITDGDPDAVWLKSNEGWDAATALGTPDLVLETDATQEQVFVFPDAGCC